MTDNITHLGNYRLERNGHEVHLKTIAMLKESNDVLAGALCFALEDFLAKVQWDRHWLLGVQLSILEGNTKEAYDQRGCTFESNLQWLLTLKESNPKPFASIRMGVHEGEPLSINHFVKPFEVPIAGSSLWGDADYTLMIPVASAMTHFERCGFKVHDYYTAAPDDPDPLLWMVLVNGSVTARLEVDFRVLLEDAACLERTANGQ